MTEVDSYSLMAPAARVIAVEARERIAALHGSMVSNAIEIGRTLIEVKEALGHGAFLPWIKAEFGWSERTAQNYMSAATAVRNPQSVAHLPVSTIYALASPTTPAEIRASLMQRFEKGEQINNTEVTSLLREARGTAAHQAFLERKEQVKRPSLNRDEVKRRVLAKQARHAHLIATEREERAARFKGFETATIGFIRLLNREQAISLRHITELGSDFSFFEIAGREIDKTIAVRGEVL